MHFKNVGIFLSALLWISGPSVAATYDYVYQGNTLTLPAGFTPPAWYPDTLPAYSGLMRIKEEALPGGTLADATVTFTVDSPSGWPPSPVPLPAGLLYFDIFPFTSAIAGASISFTTDSLKRIVTWNGQFLDGPPDGGITSSFGDFYLIPESPVFEYRASPGTWSAPALVPVPAGLGLLLMALAALGAVRMRKS